VLLVLVFPFPFPGRWLPAGGAKNHLPTHMHSHLALVCRNDLISRYFTGCPGHQQLANYVSSHKACSQTCLPPFDSKL